MRVTTKRTPQTAKAKSLSSSSSPSLPRKRAGLKSARRHPRSPNERETFGLCILAGGASRRMGRNKAQLRLQGRSLLAHVRTTARALGRPVRIIRKDWHPGCGPLGGVLTALRSSTWKSELFLACDMPFVSLETLRALVRRAEKTHRAVFTRGLKSIGFPFLVRVEQIEIVEKQWRSQLFSLRELARALKASPLRLPRQRAHRELFNINTPLDWQTGREMAKTWRKRH